MSVLLTNLTTICRVCLEQKDNMLSIYDCLSEEQSEPFYSMLMNCASVKIRKGDGLPDLLCSCCRIRLEAAYYFKLECEQTDLKLRQIIFTAGPEWKIETQDTDNLEKAVTHHETVKMELDIGETEFIHYGNNESESEDPLYPNMYVTTEMRRSKSPEVTTEETLERTRGEFQCSVCHRKFDLKSNMIAHMWLYHCPKNEPNNTNVPSNVISPASRKSSESEESSSSSEDDSDHGPDDVVKRTNRNRSCKTANLSMGVQRFVCYICTKRFESRSEYTQHKEEHPNPRYVCDVDNCDRQFPDYLQNAVHRKNDHFIVNYLSCPQCDRTFNSKKKLDKHLDSKHSADRPFRCLHCSKAFQEKWTLENHMAKHNKEYKCNFCEKNFSTALRLSNHARVHTRDKPFTCEECGKSFSQKCNLDKHISAAHKGLKRSRKEKNHLCPHCGQTFGRPVDLTTHIRIHTGVKPFSCDLCEYRCHDKQLLRSHVRKHTGDRPYKCSYCDKSFGTRSYLTIHERFHSGHRPYICSSCQKGFTNSKDLKVHERTHTGIKLFTCNICNNSFTTLHYLRVHVKKHESH